MLVRPAAAASAAHQLVVGYEGSGGVLQSTVETPAAIPGATAAPDLTRHAQKVMEENPGVVLALAVDLIQQVRNAGYTGPYVVGDNDASSVSEQVADLPSDITQNLYRASQHPPFDLVKTLPVVKRFKKELKAIGASGDDALTTLAWNAWQAMYAIADQAVLMRGDFTGSELTEAFNASAGIELVTGATWVPSAPGPPAAPRDSTITYWFAQYVGDGEWKLVTTPKQGNTVDPSVFTGL